MFSVPKLSEARGNAGAASVAALCALSMCAGGAYAVDAARHPHGGVHVVPVPRLVQKPNKRTDLRWALFTYSDREPHVSFRCSLDGGRFARCSARALYGLVETQVRSRSRCTRSCGRGSRHSNSRTQVHSVLRGAGRMLALGNHTFRVKARSKTGRESRLMTFTWTVLTKAQLEAAERAQNAANSAGAGGSGGGSGSGIGGSGGSGGGGGGSGGGGGGSGPIARTKSFVISGQPEGTLFLGGPALTIPLAIFNPNPIPIRVTSLAVAVARSPAGCSAEENLDIVQSDASPERSITVAPDSAVTLPAQGVSAPTIQLLNLPVNQDACQNATFPLTYTGSASS
jgi:uncharacterized membrane protein YgcG